MGFRLLKNYVNPDLHLPFVTYSRSGPAWKSLGCGSAMQLMEMLLLAHGRGFGVGWCLFFFSQPIQERISFSFLSHHFLQHVSN